MANKPLIISVEHMKQREQVAMLLGIRIILGEVVAITIITSSMIYLANADQLQENNTMMRTSQHPIN
jgi:hypothetical protein